MKIVPLTVMLVLLTAPAHAQGINLTPNFSRPLTSEEIERQKAIDEAYKSTINKIPEQKSTDPWGNVRSTPPANTAKSGSTKTSKTQPSQPGAK